MSEKVDAMLHWRGVKLPLDPTREDGEAWWRESNPESEWSVSREGDEYVAGFNVSYSAEGDWEFICEGRGSTPVDALEAALASLREQLPKEMRAHHEALQEASEAFIEAVETITAEHPIGAMQIALSRLAPAETP